MKRRIPSLILLALGGTFLAGCAQSPSINVLGAYFPDWMFCIIGAIVLTACVHGVINVLGLADRLGGPWLAVIYTVLAAALALGGWLVFFQN